MEANDAIHRYQSLTVAMCRPVIPRCRYVQLDITLTSPLNVTGVFEQETSACKADGGLGDPASLKRMYTDLPRNAQGLHHGMDGAISMASKLVCSVNLDANEQRVRIGQYGLRRGRA